MAPLLQALPAALIILGAQTVHAGPSDSFWNQVTDAWLNLILAEGDSAKFEAMLHEQGQTLRDNDRGGETYVFEDRTARLELYASGPSGAIKDGHMRWSGGGDTPVPPISMTYGRVGRFTHRSDLTLGSAACVCLSDVQAGIYDESPVVILPCYLGRGGGYLDLSFVYPDPDLSFARLGEKGPHAAAAALCRASTAYEHNPHLLDLTDVAETDPVAGDVEIWPMAVFYGSGRRTE